ncbi:MAG: hypothetical protein U0414_10440 [Polyangiaceae bacterium]
MSALEASYEFTSAENARIQSAATWSRLAGIIEILVGMVFVVIGLLGIPNAPLVSVLLWIAATIYIVVGASLAGAASAFTRVVDSEGDDIANMLAALAKLKAAFKVQVIVVLTCAALGFLAFCLLILR